MNVLHVDFDQMETMHNVHYDKTDTISEFRVKLYNQLVKDGHEPFLDPEDKEWELVEIYFNNCRVSDRAIMGDLSSLSYLRSRWV